MIRLYLLKTDSNRKSKAEMSSTGRNYVKFLASTDLGVNQESLCFETGPYGKPYISGHDEWQFNISHTDGMIAIAISDRPVGVDIERIKKADVKISERFFTKLENEYISASGFEQSKRFFEVWTKKESYIKYVGKGLKIPLKTFEVFACCEICSTYFVDDYVISVCGHGDVECFRKNLAV